MISARADCIGQSLAQVETGRCLVSVRSVYPKQRYGTLASGVDDGVDSVIHDVKESREYLAIVRLGEGRDVRAIQVH